MVSSLILPTYLPTYIPTYVQAREASGLPPQATDDIVAAPLWVQVCMYVCMYVCVWLTLHTYVPTYIQDTGTSECYVCHQAFGWVANFVSILPTYLPTYPLLTLYLCMYVYMYVCMYVTGGRTKHHCRKCGNVVCGKCSHHRLLLPNIHKTQKQRVCSVCVKVGR